MSLDPRQIHAERYSRIAEIIHDSVPHVTREWLRRSREVGQTDDTNSVAEETPGHVRVFLRSLARQLASTDPAALLPQKRATGLGELRWEQGEDISQVVRDYQTLRLILIDHLDSELDEPITRDELMALSLNIDEAINAAVSAFSEQETRERDKRQQELEESIRELRRFAHVVAHELRSPLNSQALSIKLLELQIGEDSLDEKVAHTLQVATKSVEQMTQLIVELLRYAEVESDDASDPQPTDCENAVEYALEHLKAEITSTGAEVRWDQLPVVSARPAGLLLLFQNLIGNAIHYRRDEVPRIHMEALDTGDGWLFRVSDNGTGIQPEDQSRIFDMFARAHANLRPRGTGIGLAMCRRIVEDFDGRIWVESEPGKGSTFYFTLPKVGQMAKQSEDEKQAARSTGRVESTR